MVSAKEHGNKKVGRRKRTERDGGGVTGRQMHECSRKEGGMRKRGGWIGLRPLGCAAFMFVCRSCWSFPTWKTKKTLILLCPEIGTDP